MGRIEDSPYFLNFLYAVLIFGDLYFIYIFIVSAIHYYKNGWVIDREFGASFYRGELPGNEEDKIGARVKFEFYLPLSILILSIFVGLLTVPVFESWSN